MRLFVADFWSVADRFCERFVARVVGAGGWTIRGAAGRPDVVYAIAVPHAGGPAPSSDAGPPYRYGTLSQGVGSFADQAVTDSVPLSTSWSNGTTLCPFPPRGETCRYLACAVFAPVCVHTRSA